MTGKPTPAELAAIARRNAPVENPRNATRISEAVDIGPLVVRGRPPTDVVWAHLKRGRNGRERGLCPMPLSAEHVHIDALREGATVLGGRRLCGRCARTYRRRIG